MTDDDPVTLSTASMVMMGATAASAVAGAGASVLGGMQAQSAAHVQAQEAMRQAALERQAAGETISREDIQANRVIGERVAAAGASGGTLAGAQPILSEDFSEQRIRDMYTKYSGNLAATSDVYAAKYATYQGKQAMFGGLFGGAENLLRGATGIGQEYMQGMEIGG